MTAAHSPNDMCPVQAACLDYAIDNHVDHGVWGGKSERERRRIARARRRGFNVTSA